MSPTADPNPPACRCNNGRLMRTRSHTVPLLPHSTFFFASGDATVLVENELEESRNFNKTTSKKSPRLSRMSNLNYDIYFSLEIILLHFLLHLN